MDAYKIVVGIYLTNHVSGALGMISREFMKADADAKRLQKTLNEIRVLGFVGAGLAGAGFMGLKALGHALKPARDYAHQLSIMNMAGMRQQEIAEAIGDAWQTSRRVITTTATENLRSLLDLRNILVSTTRENYGRNLPPKGSPAFLAMQAADWQAARAQLEPVARMEAAMRAADPRMGGGGAREFAFSAAKALDILGRATDPKMFSEGLQRMGQVGIWSQNRVTPEQYQSVAFYMRQAGIGASYDYLFGPIAALMLERATKGGGMGGGSRGVGPAIAAMYRFAVQGIGINKQTLPMLKELGLVGPNATLKTTTQGTTVGPMTGSALAATNMYDWVQKVLGPRVDQYLQRRHLDLTPANRAMVIGQAARGNQLAAWGFGQFYIKQSNIERDMELIAQAMRPDAAYKYALRHDPETSFAALKAGWENVKTALGLVIIPELVPFLTGVAGGLQNMAGWLERNEWAAKLLVGGFATLSGALLFSGTVLALAAAFKSLRLVLSGFGLLSALGAGGGRAAAAAVGGRALFGAGGVMGAIGTSALTGLSALAALGLFLPDKMLPEGAAGARSSGFLGIAKFMNRLFTGAAPGQENMEYFYGQYPGLRPPPSRTGGATPPGMEGTKSTETVEKLASVTLNGQTNLTGTVVLDMGSLGKMFAQLIAKGISEARGVAGTSGSRPERGWAPYPN